MNIDSNEGIGIKAHHKLVFQNLYTGAIREAEYDNIIVTAGKNMIAKRLAQTGNDCNITYIAVGTGAGVPAIGDTTLFTELARNLVTTISASGTVVSITGFFGAAEANGTLTEMAYFGEAATGAADSGTMLNHATISEVKTSSETMTIQSTITVN